MLDRVVVFAFPLLLLASPMPAASADSPTVDIFASAQNYSGPCPIDIVFTATLADEDGTVYGYHFFGGGFNATKQLYGYMPASGSTALENDLSIDAAHAGKVTRSIEVKFEHRSADGSTNVIVKSSSTEVTVACSSAAASPSPSGNR